MNYIKRTSMLASKDMLQYAPALMNKIRTPKETFKYIGIVC